MKHGRSVWAGGGALCAAGAFSAEVGETVRPISGAGAQGRMPGKETYYE